MPSKTKATRENQIASHHGGLSERSADSSAPPNTISTAALQVGLAHLIHEINDPLHVVYNAADLLQSHLPNNGGSGDPVVDELFLRSLKNGVEQLHSLVTSLRSELESLWEINPTLDTVDLTSVIDTVLEAEATRLAAQEICVVTEMADPLPPIQGNKKLLERALSNVCKNAIAAMPGGGVLSVLAVARDRSVVLELSDTGVGIPPEVDVFQPFATAKSGGMGLGLAVARHIVSIHGGMISYRSRSGKGTTFFLSFPRKNGSNNLPTPPVDE